MTKNENLHEFFDFTETDLQMNRQGQISEDQQLLVKSKLQNEINAVLFVALILGFITVVINLGRSNDAAEFQSYLVPPAIIGVLVFLFILHRYGSKSDYTLRSVEGKVNFVWVEERVRDDGVYRTNRRLKLHIKDVSLDVQKGLLEIIDQGDYCRFYYTGGGDIVSAEVVDKKTTDD